MSDEQSPLKSGSVNKAAFQEFPFNCVGTAYFACLRPNLPQRCVSQIPRDIILLLRSRFMKPAFIMLFVE